VTDSGGGGHGTQGEPAAAYLSACETPVATNFSAPAGIVKTPGIDDALDALESEQDVIAANVELLEGRPLTTAEQEVWKRLCNEIMRETNKRLKHKNIVMLCALPEPNGLGFVMTGQDSTSVDAAGRGLVMPSEDYTVTFTLPARERVDIARTSAESFVREAIGAICAECLEQQKKYRAKVGSN
jgi:hypothetical protein